MAEARLTPARPDVAADYLRDEVSAQRYDPGMAYQVTASVLPIRRTPQDEGSLETQALFGEVFTVYDQKDGWGWGQAAFDGYVGYVNMAGLSAQVVEATHRIAALRSYRYPAPDLKSPPLGLLSMNAKLAVTGREGDYLKEAHGGYVWAGHTLEIDDMVSDPVAVAEAFLGGPYFWGGRESLGLDCSALVQNAYERAGQHIPRDADLQERYFADLARGDVIFSGGSAWQEMTFQRGDLFFWPGHIGVMVDEARMIHATATHMTVAIDDVREISNRWLENQNLALSTVVRPHI
ncbi:MAG: NlpC/P60 family protein [Pseudomonadota bacterium]